MKKLLQGKELQIQCEKLGIATIEATGGRKSKLKVPESVLQRRVQEAKRSRREWWWWIVALISAIASVGSAIAAILAVCLRSK